MSKKVTIAEYEPKGRKQKIDPKKFQKMDFEQMPQQYQDYINFMSQHPTYQPKYNPKMMDRFHLQKLADKGQIAYDYMEKDYDEDGQKDVVVFGKKGVKAFNGYSLAPASWVPDRDFYVAQKEPINYKNKGELQRRRQTYMTEDLGMPEPDYDDYGRMINHEAYKAKRNQIYEKTKAADGSMYNYKINRKPKMKPLRQIFADIVVAPLLKTAKDFGLKFDTTTYQQILSKMYANFILDPELFDFNDRKNLTAYLRGRLSNDKEGNKIKNKMLKSLNGAREGILTTLFNMAMGPLLGKAQEELATLISNAGLEADAEQLGGLHEQNAAAAYKKYRTLVSEAEALE